MKRYNFSLPVIAIVVGTAFSWTHSAVHEAALQTAPPTTTREPWQCVVANLTQYFDVPKPRGGLLDAIHSYGEKLIEPYTLGPIDCVNRGCFPAMED